jgi:hypothetical protein
MRDVQPFRIFADEERKALKSIDFHGKTAFLNEEQDYDGFAVKLYLRSNTPTTVIFFCLDDRIVRKLLEDNNIDLICVFENATGKGGAYLGGINPLDFGFPDVSDGGLNFSHLFGGSELVYDIKYIFTDAYTYCERMKRSFLLHETDRYTVWDFWHDKGANGNCKPDLHRNGGYPYGTSFCLAVRKENEDDTG